MIVTNKKYIDIVELNNIILGDCLNVLSHTRRINRFNFNLFTIW